MTIGVLLWRSGKLDYTINKKKLFEYTDYIETDTDYIETEIRITLRPFLKVVTNEKGEAVGEVVTIIC
jgi:hypothetical protein